MRKIVEKLTLWRTFYVYGSFTEPTMGMNFVIVRAPEGRIPWSKEIAPALARLVRPWFAVDEKPRDRIWNVDGDPGGPGNKPLWEMRSTPRYEWDGKKLVKVP